MAFSMKDKLNIDVDLLDGLSSGAFQPLGNELTALQALADTAGYVYKTGNGAYAIQTPAAGVSVADLSSTAETLGGSAVVGVATTAARSDHKHAITDISGADILAKLLTVDGGAEGLNADTLDGYHETSFFKKNGGTITGDVVISHDSPYLFLNRPGVTPAYAGLEVQDDGTPVGSLDYDFTSGDWLTKKGASRYKIWDAENDGAGSGLDADLLDGLQASAFQPVGNELTALQALADTAGFLKKTGDGAYTIDTGTYLPTSQVKDTDYDDSTWQVDLTGVPSRHAVNTAIHSISTHPAVNLGTTNGLSLDIQTLSLQLASGSQPGALSAANWTTFNNKEPAIASKLTAFNKNYGVTATDVKVNGTQGVGSVDAVARIDHVHPVDTSRQAADATLTSLAAVAATAANDFMVATGTDAWTKKTLAETKTILGIDTATYQVMTQLTGKTINTNWGAFVHGVTLVDGAAYMLRLKVTGTVTTTIIQGVGMFVQNAGSPGAAGSNEIALNCTSAGVSGDKKVFLRQVHTGTGAWTFEIAADSDLGAAAKIDATFVRMV